MPINVSEALDGDTAEIVTVERTAGSSFVDGLFVAGSTSTFKTICSVQQPTSQDLLILEEGERNKDIRKFISKKSIRGTSDKDGIIADRIYYKTKWYKIISPADWDAYGHTTALGARD